jgi:ribosomal-protein-alanine N-acetyltransferase
VVPLQLCRLTSEDIQPVLEIEHLSFRRPWRQQSFVSELTCQQACALVVRLKSQGAADEIAGYMCLRFILNEMHILKIAVAQARRRRGIATWLLGKAFQLGMQRGAVLAQIEVRPSNEPALALYQKLGFEYLARRPGYYPETGEDALVLVKYL